MPSLRVVCFLCLMLTLLSCAAIADDLPSAPTVTAPVEEPAVTQPEPVQPTFDCSLSPDMITTQSSLSIIHQSMPISEPNVDSKPKSKPNKLAKIVKNIGLIGLTDSATNEFTRSALRGFSACKLADSLNVLGSKSVIGILGLGYVIGGPHAKSTYGTALEAAGDAMLMTESLKYLTGRMRPRESDGDPFEFEGPGSGFASFPSGHTSNAFAIATVLASKHPHKKWLYYALAAGVGYARMQKQAHFGSDVFAGAVIGIYSGKRAVKGKSFIGKLVH